MSNSSPAAIFAQDSSAHFQAWVSEVVTALFTTLGVTQTSDTGQINPATVSVPVTANASAGYVIGRFNDALQSTAPIFFKLEFGSGSAAADPFMWLTVGTSSNGSGTIGSGGGGAVTSRVGVLIGTQLPNSLVTAYTSRYVYVGTSQCGFLGLFFKYGASTSNTSIGFGAFLINRTTDSSGNATAAGILVITCSTSATPPGAGLTNGNAQNISFANSSIIPATPSNGWESVSGQQNWIVGQTTTIVGSTGYVAPVYTVDPVPKFNASLASALIGDFAAFTTSSLALIGSTPMTFMSAAQPFGANGFNNGPGAVRTLLVPWF
jgi:hypothetical protein